MAIHKGSEGTVKVGSDAIAEIRSYSIEETAATIESTTMGDTARSYESSLTDGTGTIDVYWDETDTAQNAIFKRIGHLSEEEEEALLEYLSFLRSRNSKRRGKT